MRIGQVYPQEERAFGICRKPCIGLSHNFRAKALDRSRTALSGLRLTECGAIVVETTIETWSKPIARVQFNRSHESYRVIARTVKNVGKKWNRVG